MSNDPLDGKALFFANPAWCQVDVVQLLDDIQREDPIEVSGHTPCVLLYDQLKILGGDLRYWEELAGQWGGELSSEDGVIQLIVPEDKALEVDRRIWKRMK